MPTYSYSVLDETGSVTRGKVDGDSIGVVATQLRDRGYRPIDIEESGGGVNKELSFNIGSKVKLKELAVFARQMSTMIAAGVPIIMALSVLGEQTDNLAFRKTIGAVRSTIEAGDQLSTAMAQHERVFPELMVSMVKAGEKSNLVIALERVADNYEKEVKLKGEIKSALAYPIVVFSMSILISMAMLIFIVPTFTKMFASLGGTLPLPTRILMLASSILTNYWYIVGAFVIAALVAWRRYKIHPAVRAVVDPLKLKFPVFGKLNKKLALSRFSRNFSGLYSSGVSILDCLDLSADASGNLVYANLLRKSKETVAKGESFSSTLKDQKEIPVMIYQMIAVGEESGQLDDMMGKIADFYDAEVEAATKALTSMIEPLMIAVLGGIVGSMLIALYMPMFKIFDLIK